MVKMDETRADAKVEAPKPTIPSLCTQDPKTDISDSLSTSALAALQSDVQPVGHDYVEEVSFDMYTWAGAKLHLLSRNTFKSWVLHVELFGRSETMKEK